MSSQDTATTARTPYDLFNKHNSDSKWLDHAAAAASEDCELLNVPLSVTLRGLQGFKQFLQGWATAFPDSKVEITSLFATESQAVVEFIGRGTQTGPLMGPSGEIPPTGRKVELRFCDVHRIKNGKIVSLHSYYDALGLMQQLGLVPSMR